jgi:hypothetical protein
MSIVNRAVKESKDVARLAVDAAKNELVEQLNPMIQKIIDSRMRDGTLGKDVAALEGVNRMRQADDGYGGITDFEEGKDMKNEFESVSALFPGVNEVADDMDESAIDETEQVAEAEDMEEAKDDMDEELEISESELEAMYAEALQLEVEVKKGFSDMAKPHELGAGAKYNSFGEPASLETLKSGEHQWDTEEPPAKKDFTVKEKAEIRQLVKAGMAENKALANQNAKLTEMVKALHGKLTEMNLLNSKILHVNKFMTAHRLTKEQKKSVIESIDKGSSVNEVRRIFSILESSFRAAGAVTESTARRPHGDSSKRRTSGAPDAKVLRESADKAEGSGNARWKQLAGLIGSK